MKNFNKVSILSALFLLMSPVLIFASEFRAGQQPSFASSERADGNLYMAGGAVISAGNASKDLLIAGGTVLSSGQVIGDMFVVGGDVTILGQVFGDARVGGGNIIISGDIFGDAVVGGGQIILSGKSVGGDVALAGGTVRVDSEIKGNVKIAGGEIYLNSSIGGNVNIKAEKLTLGPNADIRGNLKYEAKKPAIIENGGVVRGETIFTELSRGSVVNRGGIFEFFTVMILVKFLMIFIASLIVGLVFRKYSKELVEKATANPLKEFGRGIVTMIVLPVLSIILLVTIIGIPLGILGLLSTLIIFIFVSIITPIFLGAVIYGWMFKKSDYIVNWKTILLGSIVYVFLGLIPFIGWIAICVLSAITLGAMLNIKWQVLKGWR